jgi:hypothetical protein
MKVTVAVIAMTMCIALAPLAGHADADPPDEAAAKGDVLTRFRQWEQAAVSGQGVAHFQKNAADDYVFTSVSGEVSDKQACIAALKEATIESWKIDDVKVRVFGETLIATGRAVVKGAVKGKEVHDIARFTETCIRRDGRWLPVALQMTRIAEPQP